MADKSETLEEFMSRRYDEEMSAVIRRVKEHAESEAHRIGLQIAGEWKGEILPEHFASCAFAIQAKHREIMERYLGNSK